MKKNLTTLLFTFVIGSSMVNCVAKSPAPANQKDEDITIPYMEFDTEDYSITTPKPTYTEYVTYEDYGAKGNGVDDDADAIYAAHEYANSKNLPVKATPGKKYLIKKSGNKTAMIRTDTDWSGAEFIIDDSELAAPKDRNQLFSVRDEHSVPPLVFVDYIYAEKNPSYEKHPELKTLGLKKDATNLGITLTAKSVVWLEDNNVVRFRRCMSGRVSEQPAQEDVIIVDENGDIDKGTPLNWSYNTFTRVHCRPIKEQTLYITGGTFRTIVNRCEPVIYVSGGIEVLRSNVVIDNVNHKLENERTPADYSSPYYGIFYLKQCAYITIKNCNVSSHITYANKCGTYDIYPLEVAYLTIRNCHEFTSICDFDRWGVFGSNFCKNVRVIDSELSRFDAHKGVTNAYIKNSTIGWAGINLIGEGTFRMEDSKCYGANFIRLREDFGSSWHGNIYIKDCDWYITRNDGKHISSSMACIIGGNHICDFDFGSDTYMPKKIFIDGFTLHDEIKGKNYYGPYVLNPIIDSSKDVFNSLKTKYPYHLTEDIYFRNFKCTSSEFENFYGVSSNSDNLFNDIRIHSNWNSSDED